MEGISSLSVSYRTFWTKVQWEAGTSQSREPSTWFLLNAFDRLAEKTNEILGVFLSRKFSATYEAAPQGVRLMKRKCQVAVIDSTLAAMGQGSLVIATAKKALAGASLDKLVDAAAKTIPQIHIRATLNTLK